MVTLSPKIFGEPQYGLKKSKSGVAGSTSGNARTPNFGWDRPVGSRGGVHEVLWKIRVMATGHVQRARTPLPTGTSSHSRGTSAPCSPPTPATTRVHGCDDTHDATNVKYYSVRSWKNKMNRRKLHDCCKTFVRGCLLALCGAWRAAVRQSAASHRSYIGPGAPMCKPEARPCFTHRCTAAPAEPAMRRSCLSTGPRGQAGHGEHQHQHLSH